MAQVAEKQMAATRTLLATCLPVCVRERKGDVSMASPKAMASNVPRMLHGVKIADQVDGTGRSMRCLTHRGCADAGCREGGVSMSAGGTVAGKVDQESCPGRRVTCAGARTKQGRDLARDARMTSSASFVRGTLGRCHARQPALCSLALLWSSPKGRPALTLNRPPAPRPWLRCPRPWWRLPPRPPKPLRPRPTQRPRSRATQFETHPPPNTTSSGCAIPLCDPWLSGA